MKKLFIFTLATFTTLNLFALTTATIRTNLPDNRTFIKEVPLKDMGNKTWRVHIPKDNINVEAKNIEIVLPETSANKGESGYYIMPHGTLGYFTKDNGTETSRNPIKMFGMKKSDSCVVGIVKSMELEYTTVVEAKNGKYKIFPRFNISAIEHAPYEDIIVDFVELEGDDADYSGMAKAYRQYQLDRGEVQPLKEKVKTRPALKYAVESMTVRVPHGRKKHSKIEDHIPNVNEPEVNCVHSFEKLKNMIIELKALGVEQLEVCSVAWNTKGHDGRFPQLFPVEETFGGEAKLREAVAEAKKAGYHFFFQNNYTDAYKCADCWSESYIRKHKNGQMARGGRWSGGRAYEVCQKAMLEKFVCNDFKRIKDLGAKGMHHIDVFSAITPPPCNDKHHPATRKDNAKAMRDIALLARETFGGFGSECGFDHLASVLDFALYTGTYPQWTSKALCHEHVPLWQIVYHGIILSNPHYATIDHNFPQRIKNEKSNWPWHLFDKTTSRLKLYEAGGRPTYYFESYKDMKHIKDAYDEYQPLKYLQYEFIQKHKKLAEGVFLTAYSDGSEIITNYNKTPFTYKNKIVKPEDFKLFK
ncbi:MAG: hypothetical protein E7035_10165 [Verrucomicrobiaceae bacterium]|nr:hypothetical protein [Verrucomicrobiaceae bacterium]